MKWGKNTQTSLLLAFLALVTPCPAAKTGKAPPPPTQPDMVLIPGGTFRMGSDHGQEFEKPVHKVTLKPYWIGRHEITVAEYRKFVEATGYMTQTEKAGSSKVFDVKKGDWVVMKGVSWRHPDGPKSQPAVDEPVSQVSWNDATAYTQWAGARLPTEAEWEFASRGGLDGAEYAWGNDLRPGGKPVANWWQGHFPDTNTLEDGYLRRAPVGKFPPNGYGLCDMTGNVWEWCSDWYGADYYAHSPRANPTGPPSGEGHVLKGGSFLCSENFCTGFRVSSRRMHVPDTGLNNMGFRIARDATDGELRPSKARP
ncbi:MAG: formylglycine-generating enzyme family protein [Candidatus Sumerlaeaceae bacterium]|nr:formylglycine-generating enzyme family protein [Candidatus Sumerlaeaceae bacterium]